jgi:hypothetical protein
MLAGFWWEVRRNIRPRCIWEDGITIHLKEMDGNDDIFGSLMSLIIMCHLCIDECRTGGSIRCGRCWYPDQNLRCNLPGTKQFFAIDDVLPFCGIVGRHNGSGRWQCPVCLSVCIYQSKYHFDIRVRRTSVTFGADYDSYTFFEEICCFRLQSRKFNLRQNEQCSYIFKMELCCNLSDTLYSITSQKTIVFRHWTFQSSSRIL